MTVKLEEWRRRFTQMFQLKRRRQSLVGKSFSRDASEEYVSVLIKNRAIPQCSYQIVSNQLVYLPWQEVV